jgi:hypothetical protein
MALRPFTEPTTHYWQDILPAGQTTSPPWKFGFPALLPDSRVLMLPIRPLNNEDNDAVASLLVNQASISVVAELGKFLAERVCPFEPDVVIGLPTLGLSLAPIVAQSLGHRKFIHGEEAADANIETARTLRPLGIFTQVLVRRDALGRCFFHYVSGDGIKKDLPGPASITTNRREKGGCY